MKKLNIKKATKTVAKAALVGAAALATAKAVDAIEAKVEARKAAEVETEEDTAVFEDDEVEDAE